MAQSPSPLSQAVQAAWQQAVQAREAQARLQQAQAARTAAAGWTPLPPALELAYRSAPWQREAGGRETELGLSLPLWYPGQRAARLDAAEADAAAAEAALQAARLKLAGEVREAAWELAGRQAELRLAEEQLQGLRTLADDVDRRVAAGDLARSDALAARSEMLVAQGAVAQARQALTEAQAHWSRLTGLPPLADPAEPAAAAAQDGTPRHPELQHALLAVERARRQHEALRRSRRDAPELALSARQERGVPGEASENSLGLALRVPLGPDPRSRIEEASALGERDVAEAELQRLRDRLVFETQAARAGVGAAELQLAATRERAELLGERARLLDKSFRLGETALPELLRALAQAREAAAAVARQQAALGLARARLHQTLGLMP